MRRALAISDSTNTQCGAGVFECFRNNDDSLIIATLLDVATHPCPDIMAGCQFNHGLSLIRSHINGKTSAHIEIAIGFFIADWAMFLNEPEQCLWFTWIINDVDERLDNPHELAPTVTSNVDGIVHLHVVGETRFNHFDVNRCGLNQRSTIRLSVSKRCQIALWQLVSDPASHREAIGMDARASQ